MNDNQISSEKLTDDTNNNSFNFEIDGSRSSHGLLVNQNDEYISNNQQPSLRRNLTLFDGLGIIIGIILGSGIFSSPGIALVRAGSPLLMLLSWILSGSLVVIASQCFLELGTMLPVAGGDYEFIRRAYGDTVAFTFAWYYFFISKSGGHAIIATIFGRYINSILLSLISPSTNKSKGYVYSLLGSYGDESAVSKLSSVAVIILLSGINCMNMREPVILQNILTSIKVFLLVLVFVCSVAFIVFSDYTVLNQNIFQHKGGDINVIGIGSSMIACLWSFDGWSDLNFMQEELINPSRDYVRGTLISIAIVTLLYFLANLAYLSVLSVDEISSSQTIVVTFGETLDSFWGTRQSFSSIFAVGVAISTAGSLNGSIMTGGRAFYAIARQGQAPAILTSLTSGGVPYMSVIGQMIWSIALLCLPGSNFSSLLDYFGPMSWIYYALTCFAVIRLRDSNHMESQLDRPYKVRFYPMPVILVVIVTLVIVITSIVNEPLYTCLAIASVGLSVPVHLFFYNKRENIDVDIK